MKRFALVLMLASLLALGGQAFAEMCTIDAVPAATLLVPYFEVDLSSTDGRTTLFSVNNASAAPALAHVTLWTDWSQPSVDFDMFLTGYDVITVNMRDVFNGIIPITADAASDPTNTISPHGSNPGWDGSFPGCNSFFPFFQNPVITGDNLVRVVNGHTGQNVLGNGCMGQSHGEGIARGYITIDDATRCSIEFPSDAGYFGGLDPVASNENQLWGDYFIVDPANNFAFGDNLVHVEADAAWDFSATGYSFYGRYVGGAATDAREPLGTTWAVRYLTAVPFDGTDLIVWRDSTSADTNTFYTCGVGPSWYPMNETEVVAFDEEENAVELCFAGPGGVISPPSPGSDAACFPLETQRVAMGQGDLSTPFPNGWVFLNLNVGIDSPNADVDFGTLGTLAQSYVAASIQASGLFQVGLQAIELTSACEDVDPLVTDTGSIGTL